MFSVPVTYRYEFEHMTEKNICLNVRNNYYFKYQRIIHKVLINAG